MRNSGLFSEIKNNTDPTALMKAINTAAREDKEFQGITEAYFIQKNKDRSLMKTTAVGVCEDQRSACNTVSLAVFVAAGVACGASAGMNPVFAYFCLGAAEGVYLSGISYCTANYNVCIAAK